MSEFKKVDRVRVKTMGRFEGQIGTVIMVSQWVFADEEALNYIVDLDSGVTVTCDPEDIELYEEED